MKALARNLWHHLPAPLRLETRRLGTKALRAARRATVPISASRLRAALDRAIGGDTPIMLVHSSLSSCGYFTAGPHDVLRALADRCDTLGLVTHSYCYPGHDGEPGPVYDASRTPSQSGRLTELFRATAGALRSIHATHSLALTGPLSRELADGHFLNDSPCGAGTPYNRIVDRKGSVLMFGVSFHVYTLFHTAEFMSGSDAAYEHGTVDKLRVIDDAGVERVCLSQRQSRAPMRFEEAGHLLERVGLARRVPLGRNALLFVPDVSKVHDFMVERLRRTPDFLRQSCLRPLQ